MDFSQIPGLQHIKKHLQSTLANGRTAHAQLFVGKPGHGTLATAAAFSQMLITKNLSGDQLTKAEHLCQQFSHPDMHFVYPINLSELVENKKPLSKDFAIYWREFLQEQIFEELHDWYKKVGIEKRQGIINVAEAADIGKQLSLKSYGGNAKVMVIWYAEKMNTSSANKLLKLIEEPPENTYLILVSEHPEDILLTIRSRCQILEFPPFSEEAIATYLVENLDANSAEAHQIAAQSDGDLAKAIKRISHQTDDQKFEAYFIAWVRSAFQAKKQKSAVKDLMHWATQLDKENRETQIRFIDYCLHFFRQALLQNYKAESLVYMKTYDEKFKFANFAKFINGNNLDKINIALQDASYHIERNANGKLVFTDLSLQLTRFIHQ
ncbi:DNA polymerase III subunit [Psychroflexus planctonicus]|uniref:DNA polymerase III subunit delta n=1 Tax=Psychroflexus planctonicus TaxID=1526575 RepID=A0ABQ1SLP9_9FLAO|nr:DNA polymerase III subunit delta' [Psychroflexus planctonicus]GGE40852.1 DNA polymerase III subunit delta' [Psychroflexus planctonicus]